MFLELNSDQGFAGGTAGRGTLKAFRSLGKATVVGNAPYVSQGERCTSERLKINGMHGQQN